MKNHLFAVSIALMAAPFANAQETTTQEQTAQQQVQQQQIITAGTLINVGYEVKAFASVNGAFVLTLQRGPNVFICETSNTGQTRVCVAIQ